MFSIIEIFWRRLIDRLELQRTGKESAMGQRFFELHGFFFAEFCFDSDLREVAGIGRIQVGIDHSQVKTFADME